MPAAKQVVRTENGATYRLTEWLGDGMIAAVWRGVGERDRAGEQVAVKIAYPALSPTLQKQFDTEYDTLTDLLTRTKTWPSKGGKPPVPAFIHKAKLEHEEQDALVTELIQTKTLSKLVLDEDDLNRRQELLVEPAYQYAWFLDFMHNRAGIRQSDRKLGDLYWDEEQDRLIMLDWTVVEKDIERAPEDVYHFGEMWYALLLNVTPTLKLGIAASQEWERLSAAWRMVLESCLRPNRQARSTAKGLLTMLYERRRAYWRTGKELEMQGLEAWEQARDLKDLRQAERAWWLLDLAWQKGLEDAGGPAQAAGAMCKQRGQEHLRDIKDHLEYAQSDAAESALKEAQGEMSDDSDDQLRLARWRCLVNAAKKSREEKISAQFRDAAPHLTAAVAALEAGQWLKARNELKPALDNLLENSETRVILDDLGRELDLHLTLAEAVSLRENTKFADAAEKYGLAQKLLAEIAYLDALEPNIADLPYEKAKCEHLAETEAKLREAQEQLAHLVNDGNYAEARGLHDRVLPLTRGKVEARQALTDVFAPVRGLEALSQACQHPDTPPEELVKQAQDLITQFPDHTTVQREVRQVVTHLLSELEQRAQEARFIEDIDDALNLGKALQSLGESAQVVQDTLERHWQAVADLEKKRGAFKQSIEKIVKEIKEEVAPQQMAQAQQKVDKLKTLLKKGHR